MTRSYGIIVCRRMLIIVCLVHFWDQLLRVSSKCPVLIEGCAVLLFYAPRQNICTTSEQMGCLKPEEIGTSQ